MTLLSTMNRVAAQASLPTLTIVKTNTARTATELLQLAYEAGEEIARRAEWSNLYKEATIASGSTSYALPDDFHRLIQGGAIVLNDANKTPLIPVKSADIWSAMVANATTQPYFFIKSGYVEFASALTSSATIRYISSKWILSGTSSLNAYSTDGDTARFSESLLALGILWRYKRVKGLRYDDLQSEFEAELAREIAADRGIS